jgi:ATP-dependent Lon protease
MTQEMSALPALPVVPLRGGIVFPGVTTTISIGRKRSHAAAQAAAQHRGQILILVQYDSQLEDPGDKDLIPIGILATVRDVLRAPNAGLQMLVELHRRIRFEGMVQKDPYLRGRYSEILNATDTINQPLMAETIAYVEKYAESLGEVNKQVLETMRTRRTSGELADYLAGLFNLPFDKEANLLQLTDGLKRLESVREHVSQEMLIAQMRQKIQQDARESADKAQKDYILREQMKAIRKELGEDDENPIEDMRQRITEAHMPEEVEKRARKELKRLDQQPPQSAEAGVIRTYLEWLVDLPWSNSTEDNLDIQHVREVLDEDHYGLEDVKERIVEYVAVRKLAGTKMKGAIVNLSGPPGVGKTSIATSVARAMGRKMIRISLGGVRDEAEIRGHRRTYIGALPGRIIRALRDAGTNNPIIVLDEIDKLGADWRGDPSSALLEVLDPAQNFSFADHYLEVAFDLSQIIFITTSNQLSTIPGPLLDRMETIMMPGYIEDEKVAITRDYLVKKQLEAHGISDEIEVAIPEPVIHQMIRHYTYEAGVRQAERNIGTIVRKLAVKVAGGENGPFTVAEADLEEFLGPQKFTHGLAELEDEVGVVTGLAVNSFGGDTLSIEVSLSEGNGKITLTGSLGDVMRESIQAALTYARSNARSLGLDAGVFDKVNVHVHVPAGATPKDGPSAGIGMATAIISAFTRRPVRREIAMTGEVTLRGKVLAIGGLKQKAIAAHRAGIKTVLFPKENAKDLPELPEQIRQELTLVTVSHLDEVIDVALMLATEPPFMVSAVNTNNDAAALTIPPVPPTGSGDKAPFQA